jgi:iron complex transport system permease protein
VGLSLASLSYALCKGSVVINVGEILCINNPQVHDIIWQLRFPRALSAFTVGGLLALAGALMQVLLRNPLADPYVLGISGGAATATLLWSLAGLATTWLTGVAWLGSLISMMLLLLLTKRKTLWDMHIVLLTGIALASACSALISFILLISPEHQLHGMLFWLLGDLSDAYFPTGEIIILLAGFLLSIGYANELNLLTRGEREAKALGVNTARLQIQIYLLSALLTAAAVAMAGCIGFVGLIVPHLLRLSIGFDHRFLLPASVLAGGSLVTFADTLARSLLAPQQLPVGIVMALIGIPLFLFLLHKNERTH